MNAAKNTAPKPDKKRENLQQKDYEKLIHAVKNYENRIKEIEGSIYWKTYQFFTKTKLILTSDSYLKSDKWRFVQRIRFLFSRPGMLLIRKFITQLFNLVFGKLAKLFNNKKDLVSEPYVKYKETHFPRENDLKEMKANLKNIGHKPSINILAFIGEQNFKYLNEFLNAIEQQVYTKYRVTFVTHQPNDKINYTLNKVIKNDEIYQIIPYADLGIHLKKINVDYCYLTSISAIPSPDCLYHYLLELNRNKNARFIYSDNDHAQIADLANSHNPYFKPGLSPQTLWSRNYIGNAFLIKHKDMVAMNLPETPNMYAMALAATHKNSNVRNIPKVLYHQIEPEELLVTEIEENHHYLNEHLKGIIPGAIADLSGESAGCFEPRFPIPVEEPLISIIIPCKNKGDILDVCLNSIFEKSTYKNFEVIIIDNGSSEKSFFSTVALWEYNYPTRVRCYTLDIPFNYSKLNNEAVKHANGEYLLFLNNDTELISEGLMGSLLQFAQLPEIGLVGPKLLYPNNTIQHAGIVLSIDETGAHVYSGSYKDTAGYFNNTNCLTNFSAVTGACMMIKRSKFEEVKGFDESLAVDCNDVELCCRLLEKGYYNLYVPNVKMVHYECLTRGNPMLSKRSMVRQQKEKSYFIEKWADIVENDPFYNPNLSRSSKYYSLVDE